MRSWSVVPILFASSLLGLAAGSLLSALENAVDCASCHALLLPLQALAHLGNDAFVDTIVAVCQGFKQGPILAHALRGISATGTSGIDATGNTATKFCDAVFGLCQAPAVAAFSVPLPAFSVPLPARSPPALPIPSTSSGKAPPSSGGKASFSGKPPTSSGGKAPTSSGKAPTSSGSREPFQVIHFSDAHIDRQYTPGCEADCTKPICCCDFADSVNTNEGNASVNAAVNANADATVDANETTTVKRPGRARKIRRRFT
ncbi:hypothetical protein PLICRDRAFT_176497 [Plicaturopsis crispa FD-325 SS-3]|nr:hypothetical protein PLICRDRAFT_176497 [Plicaturopsis crispa FD-325 SS-3]